MSGHASREAGKEFEKRIENALTAAKQSLIVAWFAHQQPLVTMHGKRIAQSGADFVGILEGSCPLAIECKSVKGLRLERSEFTVEQEAHLRATAMSGGLALAAIEYRDAASGVVKAFLLPWLNVPWKKRKTAQSVDVGEIHDQWKIPPEKTIATHVQKCPSCRSWRPVAPYRTTCCCGGSPF